MEIKPTELKKMDYAFGGEPFVNVPASNEIELKTMDYSYKGEPFVSNEGEIYNFNFFQFW